MVPQSTLITAPSVEFGKLISACEQALGRSVCEGVDNTSKKLTDAERFLSILSAMKDSNSPVGLPPHLLAHVSFSVLTIAGELDMADILEVCSGMPFCYTGTKARGVVMLVITGTLTQWRDAVVSGSGANQVSSVRMGFNQIHNLFVGHGLGPIWNDYEQKPLNDGYTLLEFKP